MRTSFLHAAARCVSTGIRRGARGSLLGLAITGFLIAGPPALAATTTTTPGKAPATGPAPTTTTTFDPSFPAIQLDTMDPQILQAAQAEVGSAQHALDRAVAAQSAAHQAAADASARLFLAARQLQLLDQRQRQAIAAVQAAHDRLRDTAVAAYVSGGPGSAIDALLGAQTIGDFARRQEVFTTVARARAETLGAYTTARSEAGKAVLLVSDTIDGITAAKADADSRAATADAAVAAATALLHDRQNLLNLVTDAADSPGTDIPTMVLDAYRRAATTVQAAGCTLQWWVLAGVGKVESDHGRLEDAHLTATGDLLPHIRGVPLDGSGDTQRVTSDGGPVVEAEGPMQFIPSTWAVAGRDGNADGKVDVDNIYDAALGAATYLCSASGDLTTDAGLTTAYLSYNHSDSYAQEVLAYARSYQAADAAGRIQPPLRVPLYTLAPPTTTTTTTPPPPGH